MEAQMNSSEVDLMDIVQSSITCQRTDCLWNRMLLCTCQDISIDANCRCFSYINKRCFG